MKTAQVPISQGLERKSVFKIEINSLKRKPKRGRGTVYEIFIELKSNTGSIQVGPKQQCKCNSIIWLPTVAISLIVRDRKIIKWTKIYNILEKYQICFQRYTRKPEKWIFCFCYISLIFYGIFMNKIISKLNFMRTNNLLLCFLSNLKFLRNDSQLFMDVLSNFVAK